MKPILIAGPTASGKSALALMLAAQTGATVVNADALQVYATWRILSARPDPAELAQAPHALYGHVPFSAEYSTGAWLREIRTVLAQTPRVIIVGGTGLNFTALTQGLADIPLTPPDIRAAADARGAEAMRADLAHEDPATLAKIDAANPMRIQRAWEVLRTTGHGLSAWQARTPPPLLPLDAVQPIVLRPEPDWLNARIARRFDQMLAQGALEEVRAALPDWDPTRPAAKAIGAPELIAHLRGTLLLSDARDQAIIASRQYAKRQRTWFRNRMAGWQPVLLNAQTRFAPLVADLLGESSGA